MICLPVPVPVPVPVSISVSVSVSLCAHSCYVFAEHFMRGTNMRISSILLWQSIFKIATDRLCCRQDF
jgi:hypothetical protein